MILESKNNPGQIVWKDSSSSISTLPQPQNLPGAFQNKSKTLANHYPTNQRDDVFEKDKKDTFETRDILLYQTKKESEPLGDSDEDVCDNEPYMMSCTLR